jgi:hypothetical protein
MLQLLGNRSRGIHFVARYLPARALRGRRVGGVVSSFQGFSRGEHRSHLSKAREECRRGQFPLLLNP